MLPPMYLKKKKRHLYFYFSDTVKHLQHLNYKISGTWPCISSIFGKLCLPPPLAKKLVWYLWNKVWGLTYKSMELGVKTWLNLRPLHRNWCDMWPSYVWNKVWGQNRWHLMFPSIKSGVQSDLHTQEVTADLGTRGVTWPAYLWSKA